VYFFALRSSLDQVQIRDSTIQRVLTLGQNKNRPREGLGEVKYFYYMALQWVGAA
jgi:hypothetical protein